MAVRASRMFNRASERGATVESCRILNGIAPYIAKLYVKGCVTATQGPAQVSRPPLYEMSKEQRRLRGSRRLGCADDQGDDDGDDDGVFAKRRWKGRGRAWCVTRAERLPVKEGLTAS